MKIIVDRGIFLRVDAIFIFDHRNRDDASEVRGSVYVTSFTLFRTETPEALNHNPIGGSRSLLAVPCWVGSSNIG